MLNGVQPQETEVVAKAKRRSFTAKYKRDIIRRADACNEPGQLGALLRREGLYSSHLSTWRRELEEQELAALAPKKRGPQTPPQDPRDLELATLRRDNARLLLRAERAEMLVEIQKKVSMLLGVELPKTDEPR
jgi:transposase